MPSLLSLGFDFKGSHYSFLARIKENEDNTEYHITVMDAALDSLLQGSHILTTRDGQLPIDQQLSGSEQVFLKSQIINSLNQYLHARAFTPS